MSQRGHIDLCSGIGGFALAAHWAGYKTKVFCEQDKFCQKVLSRHWPTVPIVSDIRDFDGRPHAGAELLTAGIPCQPYSCAGKHLGNDDDRALWPEARRIITEVQPRWVVIENVAGFIGMALDGVLSDLEAQGYETGAVVLPACAVNAPHRRERVWVVANTDWELRQSGAGYRPGYWNQGIREWTDTDAGGTSDESEAVAHAPRFGMEEPERKNRKPHGNGQQQSGMDVIGDCFIAHSHREPLGRSTESWRECRGGQPEPGLGQRHDGLPERLVGYWDGDWERGIPRIATGVPQRAAKLKSLGNSIVPQVAYEILRHLGDAA